MQKSTHTITDCGGTVTAVTNDPVWLTFPRRLLQSNSTFTLDLDCKNFLIIKIDLTCKI